MLKFYLQLRQDAHTAEAYWVLWHEGASVPISNGDWVDPQPRRFDKVADVRACLLSEYGIEEAELGRIHEGDEIPPKGG